MVSWKGAGIDLKDFFLDKLSSSLWSAIVIVLVALAAYTSFGRLIATNLGQYREPLLRELNARIEFAVQADSLQGSWSNFTPRIEMEGVRVGGDAHAPIAMELASVYAEIDVLQSLLTGNIQFFKLVASEAQLHVDVSADGELLLPGIPITAGGSSIGNPLYDFIQNSDQLQIDGLTVSIHQADDLRQLHVDTSLLHEEGFRRFKMSLLSPSRETWARVIAEGTGSLTDFQKFSGKFHIDTSLGDVAAYNNWLQAFGLAAGKGSLATEMWMDIREGNISLAARINGNELQLQGTGMDSQLLELARMGGVIGAEYRQGIWNFGLSELTLIGAEQELHVPRLTGDYDGSSLSLLSRDLDLAEIMDFLMQGKFLPGGVQQVLADLSPRGRAERIQLDLNNLDETLRWQVQANFSALGLNSFKGAPGVENASGYIAMDATVGRVQLQSSDFSMIFPKVFLRPLLYSDFNAELLWQLDQDAFHIASGPFSAQGEEGATRGLFSMSFPLQKTEVGAEMDLMVGVAETRATHRAKYLPITLSPNLLKWLEPSIGDGVLKDVGFIWRGSLRNREHRTVQLFFDVLHTELDYHPDWPMLKDVNGMVVIDDVDVDVFVDSARILDSELHDSVVKLRSNSKRQLLLDITGHLSGTAQDGLTIVNTSPLRKNLGSTFVDWRLTGPLETDLQLALNLSDTSVPPEIRVETRWSEIEIDAGALNLTVTEVDGELFYDSDRGFSARGISGSLWGEAVTADVSQGRVDDHLAELDIAIRGALQASSLRDWLKLDVMRLVSGSAEAQLHIKVPYGGGARLEIVSDLQGVALDLPAPWAKEAATSRTMNLQMPLKPGPRRLLLDLDREVYLGVLLDEGYSGGSIGFGAPVAAEEPGRFILSGALETLNWGQWSDFIGRYFGPGETGAVPATLLGVRDLQLGVLELSGQQYKDIKLSGDQTEQGWQLSMNMDWLQGTAALPADFSSLDVSLDRLDLAGLGERFSGSMGSVNPGKFSLPPTTLAVAELLNDGELWGDLAFELEDDGSSYHFRNIRGNLRGLQLGDDEGLRLDWSGAGESAETRLSGALIFQDFGEVLVQYNYDQMIQTSGGRVDLDLRWPGSPADFELALAEGKMDIDVAEGSFLKTSGATSGTLRVVGILNLADFVRRLSLDLSYMFQSGIPFDTIKGELELERGTIEVPGVRVSGHSSRFEFVGHADVLAQTVDGELVATLPIASNLPWIAALVSGLPAAAALYVISKLFTKQMDRFSSAIYQVKGPWNEPEVKFESIFDNSAERPQLQAEAVEH